MKAVVQDTTMAYETIPSEAGKALEKSPNKREIAMAYETINPFTEKVVKSFPERTNAQPQAIIARAKAPMDILNSVFTALNQGNISGAVDHFADGFIYNDYALDLEFTDKGRLTEFFQKSRELFPDSVVELVSTFESEDYAIAEWKLTTTQTVPFGSISYRSPIVLRGSTIVQIGDGNITHWSDYYDHLTSRRTSLGAFFEEWIEY